MCIGTCVLNVTGKCQYCDVELTVRFSLVCQITNAELKYVLLSLFCSVRATVMSFLKLYFNVFLSIHFRVHSLQNN